MNNKENKQPSVPFPSVLFYKNRFLIILQSIFLLILILFPMQLINSVVLAVFISLVLAYLSCDFDRHDKLYLGGKWSLISLAYSLGILLVYHALLTNFLELNYFSTFLQGDYFYSIFLIVSAFPLGIVVRLVRIFFIQARIDSYSSEFQPSITKILILLSFYLFVLFSIFPFDILIRQTGINYFAVSRDGFLINTIKLIFNTFFWSLIFIYQIRITMSHYQEDKRKGVFDNNYYFIRLLIFIFVSFGILNQLNFLLNQDWLNLLSIVSSNLSQPVFTVDTTFLVELTIRFGNFITLYNLTLGGIAIYCLYYFEHLSYYDLFIHDDFK